MPGATKQDPNSSDDVLDGFPGIAPFPDDIPTAPLLRISLERLVNHDADEVNAFWEACCKLGFFYLDLRSSPEGLANKKPIIDGDALLSQAEQLFLVQKGFFKIPVEEKQKYDFKDQGSYFGYKGYGSGIIDRKGTTDRNEFYNVSKDDILSQAPRIPAPTILEPTRPLLESFIKSSHSIVTLVLNLLNERLGLPDGTLPSLHRLSGTSGDQVRFIRAPPQPQDDHQIALGEHTDFGSVTVLFNRVGGLQVRLPKGVDPVPPAGSDGTAVSSSPKTGFGDTAPPGEQWAYVRPLPGHAIINLGDALVKFTAGILRSNIHRVVPPPGAQASSTRYSLVYFARPEDDVILKTLKGTKAIDDAVQKQATSGAPVEEEEISSKDWIIRRALGRRMGGKWEKSFGTEDRDMRKVAYA